MEQVTVDLGESSKENDVGNKKVSNLKDKLNKGQDIFSPGKSQLRGAKDKSLGERIPLFPKENIVSSNKVVGPRKGRKKSLPASQPKNNGKENSLEAALSSSSVPTRPTVSNSNSDESEILRALNESPSGANFPLSANSPSSGDVLGPAHARADFSSSSSFGPSSPYGDSDVPASVSHPSSDDGINSTPSWSRPSNESSKGSLSPASS